MAVLVNYQFTVLYYIDYFEIKNEQKLFLKKTTRAESHYFF